MVCSDLADSNISKSPYHPLSKGGQSGSGAGSYSAPAHHLAPHATAQQLLERPAVAAPTAMMADLEKREDDDHQITFFEVRTSAIVLLSRGLFQDSEKSQERALPPFVASP
jgi:hypothetical protein